MQYVKPWLSIKDQIEGLSRRGLAVGDPAEAGRILREVGYYRLTGYLYSFRQSEIFVDDRGHERVRKDIATDIATAFGVPTKQLMQSWITTLNYVRNVAAHHARLFNRKLVSAPKRPKGDAVPLLAHLKHEEAPKQFGVYSALAVMAYLLETVHPGRDWSTRVATHLRNFPTTEHLGVGSLGVASGWLDHDLWQTRV
jgi:abortive infection bacteriophage resistance protein